jgi:hypothetical protein
MGLSISRTIIDSHGGRLLASTNAGPGRSLSAHIGILVCYCRVGLATGRSPRIISRRVNHPAHLGVVDSLSRFSAHPGRRARTCAPSGSSRFIATIQTSREARYPLNRVCGHSLQRVVAMQILDLMPVGENDHQSYISLPCLLRFPGSTKRAALHTFSI